VLVLFTDSEDQDSGALEAARKAAAAGLQIFTVGIGSAEGELLRIKDAKGRTDYIRDEQGNVVKSHLNETLLQQIAGETEGFYLALPGANAIDTLYKQGLEPLPKSDSKEKLVKQFRERYHWPLAAAIVLLIAEMLFPERKREAKMRPAGFLPAKSLAAQAAALLFLCLVPGSIVASPSSALREYKAGQYDKALNEYHQLLQKKQDDPRLHFNAGSAAYQNQQFDEAMKQFDDTLSSPDLKLQQSAYYNRGNTLYHLGERDPDPNQRMESWKKSVTDFQSALKLNPQDADAKFNYEFVKKKLEELKQQQQQSKNDKSDQQENQQQQSQQNEQSKKDQQQKSEAQKNQSEQKDSSQKNEQAQQQEEQQKKEAEQKQKEQEQAKKSQKEQQKQQSKPSQGDPKENPDEKNSNEAQAAYAAGQMTTQQAQQLLEDQKCEEKMMPVKPIAKPVDQERPIRDW